MFVLENVDELLHHSDNDHTGEAIRGSINVHAHHCGIDGICWLPTANDINNLD